MVEYVYDFPEADSNIKNNYKLWVRSELKKKNNISVVRILLMLNLIKPANKYQLIKYLKLKKYNMTLGVTKYLLNKLKEYGLVTYKNVEEAKKHNNLLNADIIKKHKSHVLEAGLDRFGKRFDAIHYFYLTDFGKELIPFCLKDVMGIKDYKEK